MYSFNMRNFELKQDLSCKTEIGSPDPMYSHGHMTGRKAHPPFELFYLTQLAPSYKQSPCLIPP